MHPGGTSRPGSRIQTTSMGAVLICSTDMPCDELLGDLFAAQPFTAVPSNTLILLSSRLSSTRQNTGQHRRIVSFLPSFLSGQLSTGKLAMQWLSLPHITHFLFDANRTPILYQLIDNGSMLQGMFSRKWKLGVSPSLGHLWITLLLSRTNFSHEVTGSVRETLGGCVSLCPHGRQPILK